MSPKGLISKITCRVSGCSWLSTGWVTSPPRLSSIISGGCPDLWSNLAPRPLSFRWQTLYLSDGARAHREGYECHLWHACYMFATTGLGHIAWKFQMKPSLDEWNDKDILERHGNNQKVFSTPRNVVFILCVVLMAGSLLLTTLLNLKFQATRKVTPWFNPETFKDILCWGCW